MRLSLLAGVDDGTVVLGVGDRFQPGRLVDGLVGRDADVGELGLWAGSMPMLGVRRADSHIAGAQQLDRLASDLVVSDTPGRKEDLAVGMSVPTVAATRRKGDVVDAQIIRRDLGRVQQLSQPHWAGEVRPGRVVAARETTRLKIFHVLHAIAPANDPEKPNTGEMDTCRTGSICAPTAATDGRGRRTQGLPAFSPTKR